MLKHGMMALFFCCCYIVFTFKAKLFITSSQNDKGSKNVVIWQGRIRWWATPAQNFKKKTVCIQVIQRAGGSGSDATGEPAAQSPAREEGFSQEFIK